VLAVRAHGGRLPHVPRRAGDILLGFDRRIGAAVSATVAAHHRRRLLRLGQEGALAAEGSDWSPGEPPPRPDCSLEVLIDGEQAATRMHASSGKRRGSRFARPNLPALRRAARR